MKPKLSYKTAIGIIILLFFLVSCDRGRETHYMHNSETIRTQQSRALWVLAEGDQRLLENKERLESFLLDLEKLNITDVFVQVYRGGRAWFESTHADPTPYQNTWSSQWGDALTTLIRHAHEKDIRVHAWLNTLSLSTNIEAPLLDRLGDEAILVDHKGRSLKDYPSYDFPLPEADYYRIDTPAIWLDPTLPTVKLELKKLINELLQNYPNLDGIHLDYIRYPASMPFTPGSRFGLGLSLGHGTLARMRFKDETGFEAPFGRRMVNSEAFDNWRRQKLTELVGALSMEAKNNDPDIIVSAAVWAYANRAYLSCFQDWRGWLETGSIDLAVPMLYTRDNVLYPYVAREFIHGPFSDRIWIGLGAWLFSQNPTEFSKQLDLVKNQAASGYSRCSWDSIRAKPRLHTFLIENSDAR